MAIRWLFAAMAACIWPLTAPLAALTVLDLPPSSRWNMRYQDGSCELMRQFGTGNDEIVVQFSRTQPSTSFALRLFGKPFSNDDPYQDVRVAFGDAPATEPLKDRLSGFVGKVSFVDLGAFTLAGPIVAIRGAADIWTPEQEASVTRLTVGPQRGKVYRLQLGSMRAPMQAMRTCTDDLVRAWGYDPAAMSALLRPVALIGSPATWVTSNDYPTDLLREGKLGLVTFRLDVDEVGKVIGCTVLRRAGDDAFAKKTCEILSRRAQFLPALDREGKPTKAYWISSARWMIPQ